MKTSDVIKKYGIEEITAEEIKEYEKLIQLRSETDNKILELTDTYGRKCLFKKYFIDLTTEGLIVRNRNSTGGDLIIPTDDLKRIEEYTDTRLIEIRGCNYKFAWGYRFKKQQDEDIIE